MGIASSFLMRRRAIRLSILSCRVSDRGPSTAVGQTDPRWASRTDLAIYLAEPPYDTARSPVQKVGGPARRPARA